MENSKEKIKVSDEERERRKGLGLPVTKRLRYMARQADLSFAEKPVATYEILETLQPSGTCLLLVTLESGEEVRIFSGYFSEMQKPSFEADMADSESDE